jgi:DNA anti-recombination protein RmuC
VPDMPDDAVPMILARMREEINARFEETNARFDARFDRLERRLDRIERELIQIRRDTAKALHEALAARSDVLDVLDRLAPHE